MDTTNSSGKSSTAMTEFVILTAIIVVLAVFAVPRFRDAAERSKAGEAFNYLNAVKAAQERYRAKKGSYAPELSELDITLTVPKYFTIGSVHAGNTGSLADSWTLTLTRMDPQTRYGAYTVVFTQGGFDHNKSTIAQKETINPAGG